MGRCRCSLASGRLEVSLSDQLMTTDPSTSDTRNDLLVESFPESPTWTEAKGSTKTVEAGRGGFVSSVVPPARLTAVDFFLSDVRTWVLSFGYIVCLRLGAFF